MDVLFKFSRHIHLNIWELMASFKDLKINRSMKDKLSSSLSRFRSANCGHL